MWNSCSLFENCPPCLLNGRMFYRKEIVCDNVTEACGQLGEWVTIRPLRGNLSPNECGYLTYE